MCTLTVHHTPHQLLVTMNRDEARDRADERPPRRIRNEATRVEWLAPVDGEAGGTWIGTNDRGIHACLLNRYLPGDLAIAAANPQRKSRGHIILDLLAQGDESAVLRWIDCIFDPTPYPSFQLVVLGVPHTQSFSWDGRDLRRETHVGEWLLFTSSSWRSEDVAEYRRREFESWLREGASFNASIPGFHLLAPQDRLEWSPFMQREYSTTRSVTQIETGVVRGETEMRYWPREKLVPLGFPGSIVRIKKNDPSTERQTQRRA